MALMYNYGIAGVGADLQLGKSGIRIINLTNEFNLTAADGTTYVTVKSGNLVLANSTNTISISNTQVLGLTNSQPQIIGTGAVYIPTGSTVNRPTGAVGTLRINNDTPTAATVEYYDGTTWKTLATSSAAGNIQTELDNVETSLGTALNTDGTYNNLALTNTTIFGTNGIGGTNSSITAALNNFATYAVSKSTLNGVFPATAQGNVIYANGSNLWQQALPGATSGVQGYNAGLDALAVKISTGILVQTGTDTYSSVTLTAPAAGMTITNGDGVAGNPTFAFANDLAALESLGSTGIAVRTSTDAWAQRTITGTNGNITVTYGSGVGGNPTIDLASILQDTNSVGKSFVKIALDSYGRVTGNTPVLAADITSLVDSVYVNASGDTMAGNLIMGGHKVTSLGTPTLDTDAANKAYVDSLITGLAWKNSVKAATTVHINLTGEQTIDTIPVITGDRVLVKNQNVSSQNGIYDVSASAWTRSTDADTAAELLAATVFVLSGGINIDSGWTQTSNPIVLDSTNINWVQFSGANTYIWGTGLAATGNTINVNLGAGIVELPSDEIGIDLYDNATSALILTDNGTARGTTTSAKLHLLLDASGGLAQTASGLKINAASVSNAMLTNSSVSLLADSGSGTISLGNTLTINSTSNQGISVAVTGTTYTITAANATTSTKGVASFNTSSFSVASGAVSLNTVDVAHGGTGLTTFGTNQLIYGNGTSALAQNTNLSFSLTGVGNDIPTLYVGSTTIEGSTTFTRITSTSTNGNLNLVTNGSGTLVVGSTSAGVIQSSNAATLTVRGNTGLTLSTTTNGITLAVPTASKVSLSGPTASEYATALANNDLTNKYYVDTAIATNAVAGSIKAFQATVSLSTNATTNIGTLLPANSTILSVKVSVTVVDSSATLSVGKTGSASAYMATTENNLQALGLYVAETFVTETSATQLTATVASTGGSGSATVIVTYQVLQG